MNETDFPEKDRFANTEKFDTALRKGQCDVVDDMLDRGYVPNTRTILGILLFIKFVIKKTLKLSNSC